MSSLLQYETIINNIVALYENYDLDETDRDIGVSQILSINGLLKNG
jgi:hypothetical protein